MIKSVLVLVCLSLFASTAFANEFKGEGRFYSQKEDSQAFVKQQLLYLAFRDVITQEMDSMGLSSKLFWEKYEEKFSTSFVVVDDELKKKYGIDKEKVKLQKRQKYKDVLRSKKLLLKRKFGRIQRAIKQFSIEKLSRSPKVPNARYIRVKAKVNKSRLHEIYLKFTTHNIGRTFHNIFLSFDFQLDGTSWIDLGVEKKSDFTSVVFEHWKKWFEENSKDFIENVYIADESKIKDIEIHLKRIGSESYKMSLSTPSELNGTVSEQGDGDDGELSPSTIAQVLEDGEMGEFSKSLWLKLKINVKKKYDNEISLNRELEFNGDYLLIELGTNSFLDHRDFSRRTKTYNFENLQRLSSSIASYVYAIPLKSFSKLKNKLTTIRTSSRKLDLNINNAISLFNVMEIKDILADRGLRFQLKPVFKSFDGEIGILMLNYQGEKNKVGDFLLSLNGTKISTNAIIRVNRSAPLDITLEQAPDAGKILSIEENSNSGKGSM